MIGVAHLLILILSIHLIIMWLINNHLLSRFCTYNSNKVTDVGLFKTVTKITQLLCVPQTLIFSMTQLQPLLTPLHFLPWLDIQQNGNISI